MRVRRALLGLASVGLKYGHQLRRELEATTRAYGPSTGASSTRFRRLEHDGPVVAAGEAGEGSQKTYGITERGAAAPALWLRTPVVSGLSTRSTGRRSCA